MSLKGRVKIGAKEFVVDEAVENHYVHQFESLIPPGTTIPGKPGRNNVRPDILLWAQDDWSGGEGAPIFDPDSPSVYDTGTSANGRAPRGALSARPERNTSAQALSGTTSTVTQGSALSNHAGTLDADYFLDTLGNPAHTEARLVNATTAAEVKVATHDPTDGSVTVNFRLEPATAYTTRFEGNTLTDVTGTSSDTGTDTDVDGNEEVKQGGRVHAGGASVDVHFRRFHSDGNGVFRVRNETDATDVTSVTFTSGVSLLFTLNFTATAGKTYGYYVSNSGGLTVRVDYIEEVVTDSPADYTVQVWNTTDSSNPSGGGPTSGTVSAPTTVSLTYTAAAGKSYEYRVKNNGGTGSDAETLIVDYIEELTGDQHDGFMPMAATTDRLYLAAGEELWYSIDGKTFTTQATSPAPTAGTQACSMASDDDYAYVLFHTAPTTTTGDIQIHRVKGSTNELMYSASTRRPGALAYNPSTRKLFLWDGFVLYSYDTTTAASWTQTTEYTTGVNNSVTGAAPTAFGITAVDNNSVAFFRSSIGKTTVFEYRNGAGRPLWFLPSGFTGRAITYNLGSIFLAGGDNSNNLPGIQMYALPVSTRQPIEIPKIRKEATTATYATALAPGPEAQVLVGDNNGALYVYDMALQAFSEVDDPASVAVGSLATFLSRRVGAYGTAGGTVTTYSWEPDITPGRGTFSVDSGLFDYDLPEVSKILLGWHVVTEPLQSGQTVTVSYQLDNSGGYTSAGTISTAGAKHTFIAAPTGTSTATFRSIKVRIAGDQSTAVNAPVVYSVTTKARIADKLETWNLALRMKDETSGAPRPPHRSSSGTTLRDYLLDIRDDDQIVTFLDGYRKHRPGEYTTHTVVVDEVSDVIERDAEGTMRVKLVRVDA